MLLFVSLASAEPACDAHPLKLAADTTRLDRRSAAPTAVARYRIVEPGSTDVTGKQLGSLVHDGAEVPVVDPAAWTLRVDGDVLELGLPAGELVAGAWTTRWLAARSVDGGTCSAPLELHVDLPAPVLTTDAEAKWSLVLPWDGWSTRTFPVTVSETGGKAGSTSIEPGWTGITDATGHTSPLAPACAGGAPERRAVTSGDVPDTTGNAAAGVELTASLVARGDRTLDCSVPIAGRGWLALGTHSGTLRIASPQLATTDDVKVSIDVRVTRVAIPLLIVVAIGLSIFVRDFLQKRIELLEVKERAEAALGRAKAARATARDTEFLRTTSGAIATFGEEVAKADATATSIDTAIGVLDTAIRNAETKLRNDTDAANADVRALEDLVSPPWTLPAAVAARVSEARTRGLQARALLDGQNPSGASAEAKHGMAALATARDEAQAFRKAVAPLLAAPLPQAQKLAKKAGEALAGLPDDAGIAEVLPAVNGAYAALVGGLKEALDIATTELGAAVDALDARALPGAADLKAKVERLRSTAPGGFDDMLERHADLRALVEEGFRPLVLSGDREDKKPAIAEEVAAGNWRRAASLRISPDLSLGGAGGVQIPRSSVVGSPSGVDVRPGGAGAGALFSPLWAGVSSDANTRSALANARWWYTLVTSVAIAVVGTAQFLDGWVGTLEQCTDVFAWGLGLDVSTAFLFGLAAEVRQKAGKVWPTLG